MSDPETPTMRYADQESVLYQLKIDPAKADFATKQAMAVAIERAICERLDDAMNRSFGIDPEPEMRQVRGHNDPILALEWPLRNITGIEANGLWNGAAWVDGLTLDPAVYRPIRWVTRMGYYGIYRLDTWWTGTIRITGVWGDQPDVTIPVDVVDAATWLTVEEYRLRNTSPAGVEGPEGMVQAPRNPWRFEAVKRTIDKYRVTQVVV